MLPTRLLCFAGALLLALSLVSAGWTAVDEKGPTSSAELNALVEYVQSSKFEPKQAPRLLKELEEAEKHLPPNPGAVERGAVHSLRAMLLYITHQSAPSVREALAAAAAWREAGDGPGQVSALATAGFQEYVRSPAEGRRLIAQALELAERETLRPDAAERELYTAGLMASFQGPMDALTYDPKTFDIGQLLPGALAPPFAEPAVLLLTGDAELLERRNPDASRLADRWDSAAMAAYFGGDLPAARKLQERALAVELRKELFRAVVRRLQFLGNLTRMQGDLRGSREYANRALQLQLEKKHGPLEQAITWTQLGTLAVAEGDAAAATEGFQTAWRLRNEGKAEPLVLAENLLNLCLVAALNADPEGSIAYGRQALELLDGEKAAPTSQIDRYQRYLLRSRVLNNLGLNALARGRFEEARSWFQQTWDLHKERAPESGDAAIALFNLGTVELQASHFAPATDYFRRALSIQRRPGGDTGAQALSLANLGVTALLQKDYATAAQRLQEARGLQEQRAPASNDLALTLHNVALVQYLQGQFSKAAATEEQAWKIVSAQPLAPAEGRAEQPALSAPSTFAASLALYRYRQGQTRAAFESVERGRVRSLQQLIGERKALLSATAGQVWQQYEAVLAGVQVASERLSRAVSAEQVATENLPAAADLAVSPDQRQAAEALHTARSDEARAARKAYLQVLDERDRMAAAVRKQAPRVFPTPLTLAEARAALPADTTAVSFSVGEHETLVFLLSRSGSKGDGLTVLRIGITPAELKRSVEALRDAVTSRGGPLDVATAAGRRLFARLFPGAAGTTARASRRLLICPDSLLWDVPFAALVTNPTGKPRYLGEVPISYTQSLTLLRDFRSTAAAAAPAHPLALIVGNPRFNPGAEEPRLAQGRPGEREYLLNGRPPAPLPGTQKEAAAIAGLYGTAPLTGAACTEAEVRTRIGQADVVHLATHGYLNPGRAMSSGLLLALPETPKDEAGRDRDGVLQAWEIFGELKLRADLVVLSACETGRGRTSPGDGIVGLTRALQYAGARSVIASQWRVSDASTGKLMVELHRKLRSGLPKDRALAAAMATLRSSPETAHPYFWAPFLLVGDVDNHLARGR